MTDTLMMAYTAEMVSTEKVVACAQQYAAFSHASDLPYDTEDAVTYWINKVGRLTVGNGRVARETESPAGSRPRCRDCACPKAT